MTMNATHLNLINHIDEATGASVGMYANVSCAPIEWGEHLSNSRKISARHPNELPRRMSGLTQSRRNTMEFGQALTTLRGGGKVTREGWNGKGMYVVHKKGYPDGIAINRNTAVATGLDEGTVCAFRPYLMMCTVDGDFVPWVASQTDLLAEDWVAA